ncbi:MAG TPA: hypothetical protein VIO80_07990 [Candidatus Dormibacteraeota bacterium]
MVDTSNAGVAETRGVGLGAPFATDPGPHPDPNANAATESAAHNTVLMPV